jgi:hypothetical protein
MLVYGDHDQTGDPRQMWEMLRRDAAAVWGMSGGIDRHAKLVGLLIEAGRMLQGVADAEFDEVGFDRRSTATTAISSVMQSIADAICRSWASGFFELSCPPDFPVPGPWPHRVRLRVPEGFAFYGAYPEAYIDAARRLMLNAPPRVIGIRSIGTSLAAVVAAALGAALPATVRPVGDPFARSVSIGAELGRELLAGSAHFVIVDEGPGQSGSSFAAVAEWLKERGVPEERISFLPSHAGAPGAAATEDRLLWWRTAQREVADFGERWPALVRSWIEETFGPLDEAPRETSGGAWRPLLYGRDEDWPPTVPAWERRKFLVRSGGKRLLAKFAGLGRIGEEKLAIARALHSEGLVAEPVRLVHGFLVERWCEEESPLARGERPIAAIGRYVGMRAKLLPAASGSGASVDGLLTMARRNVSLEFGEHETHCLAAWDNYAERLERRIVRVRTDNRMQPHEWLRTPGDRLIKADALDHHCAHDLVGCQDMAWDVAGAICEFGFDRAEQRDLVDAAEDASGRRVDPELLDFCRVAYLAFRLGQARIGAAMVADARERQRIGREGDRYAAELQHLLESTGCATRPTSLVD